MGVNVAVPAVDYGRTVSEPDAAEASAVVVEGSVPADALTTDAAPATGFTVRLANFTGPFDLLLTLIGKHKLDVTEVALSTVTDEFIAYIRAMGDDWPLDEASEFLVVAATLLDLKAARLLPAASVENEEDLALLEARDLLFARLLQYKAFKEAAAHIQRLEVEGARRYPRAVSLEPRYAEALPELVLGIGPARLLKLAIKAMTPKPTMAQMVSIAHIHDVKVSVREHAIILRDRIRRSGTATFQVLTIDCQSTLEVVARFLALLELYRENLVGFEQVQALGELTVRWTGGDAVGELKVDEYAGTPAEAADKPAASEAAAADGPATDEAAGEPAAFDAAAAVEPATDGAAAGEPAAHGPGAAVEPATDGAAAGEPAAYGPAAVDEPATDDAAAADVPAADEPEEQKQ
ncbi:hypothetical protein Air01nite_69880 [Asanoa iriomotensis]|uniref:Segregation and condensation protein A n=1 Tax=Asanoa iriomotensis TaxID=234613 RepID=A0ABQ4CDN3_9ACTN|nr:hypothetical protein Air01nite_69880 [Asanoa iriomotensis]